MVTEPVDIPIRTRGAGKAKAQIAGIGTAAKGATVLLRRMQNALFVLGGAGLLRGLVNQIDTITTMENRLKLVTTSSKNLQDVQTSLFQVANRTRTSFEATSTVFSRMALSVKELGKTQREVLDVTESLNKAAILSGASFRETNAALVQLTQGMASNRLSGDELRSVLEQLPFVADIIAKSMGKTRGELKQLGKEGKIATKEVFEAFEKNKNLIDEQFAKLLPTINQSLTVFNNKWLEWLDTMDDAKGVSAAVANAILLVADNIDILISGVTVLGATLATFGLSVFIGRLFTAGAGVSALWGILAAHPFAALAAAIVAATGAAIAFTNSTEQMGSKSITMRDTVVGVWNSMTAGIAQAENGREAAIRAANNGIEASNKGLVAKLIKQYDEWAPSAVDSFITFADTARGVVVGLVASFPAILAAIPTAFKNAGIRAANFFLIEMRRLAGQAAAILSVLGGTDPGSFGNKAADALIKAGQSIKIIDEVKGPKVGEDLGNTIAKNIVTAINEKKFRKGAEEAVVAMGQAAKDRLDQFNKDNPLNLDVKIPGATGTGTAAAANDEAKKGVKKLNDELQRQKDLLDQIKGPAKDYQETLAALNALLAKGLINQQEYTQALREARIEFLETQRDFASGVELGFLNILDSAGDFTGQISDLMTSTFDQLSGVLANFVKTGKLDFTSLINSMIDQLSKLATNALFNMLFSSLATGGLGGGAGGGILAGITSLLGFANGGQFTVPGGASGTDSQLVGFRASPGERVTVQTPGQQEQTDKNINVNEGGTTVMNFFDKSIFEQWAASNDGRRVILNIVEGN